MKKFVKIISVFMCALLLVTGFFFAPKNMNSFMLSTHAATTQADIRATSQTYDYSASLSTEYTSFGNYAIEDIEYYYINGSFVGHLECNLTISADFWVFRYTSASAPSLGYVNYFVLNSYESESSSFDLSFLIIPRQLNTLQTWTLSSSNGIYDTLLFISGSVGSCSFDVYFSNSNFSVIDEYPSYQLVDLSYFSLVNTGYSYYSDTEDFSSLVDMNSDTNFIVDYNFFEYNSSKLSFTVLSWFSGGVRDFNYSSTISLSSSRVFYRTGGGSLWNYSLRSLIMFRFYVVVNRDFSFSFNSFDFRIYRPIYRVNNTLTIFNFDYDNYLYTLKHLSYTLRKDNDLYDINFDSSLPNDKYLSFYNEDLNNIQFDEYISLYLDNRFDHDSLNSLFFVDLSLIDFSNYTVSFPLGFDFNFTYYTEPLVSTNGSYNYTFEKPGYVDMPFSLAPFYIPVLEAVENVMIFLLFYCPITSDIIELLHFDEFLGGLLNIFNMFIDSQVGDFILGCFAFLILWGILSSLLPKALSSARSVYSNSQFVYNRRRNREDRQKERLQQKEVKYTQKMIKVEERYNKRRRKKE